MTEMVHGAVPLAQGEPVLSHWWRTVDRWSLGAVLMLMGIGVLLSLAASPPLAARNDLAPFHYTIRQIFYGALALATMLALSLQSPVRLRRLAVVLFAAGFAALALLPVLGTDFGKGAVRWYALGIGAIQPSEFVKPGFIVLSAWMMSAADAPNGPPGRSLSFALLVIITAFLVAQPDYGQAALIVFGWAVLHFVAGARLRLVVILLGLGLSGGWLAYQNSAHFAGRIDSFLEGDPAPRSQMAYAADAIGEGGLFGVGVGAGEVKWRLPDAHTDFIVAVAAEEYGFVLVAVMLALYAAIVLRSLDRLRRERDGFIRLAGAGLAALFAVQALINIGVAARLLPPKGMTLPFISYGGSSMLALGISMGLLLAFTRNRPQGEIGGILARAGR